MSARGIENVATCVPYGREKASMVMLSGGTRNGMENPFQETDTVSGLSECTSDEEMLRTRDGCTGGVDAITIAGRRSRKMTAAVMVYCEAGVVPIPASSAIILMVGDVGQRLCGQKKG
jgi:hypothetical protein